jgi:hypothetical protein
MSAMSRNKGARAEVAVVNYLRSQGFEDARRYLSGDGRQPGDIDGFHPLICLEVKDRKSSAWPTWCRQVAAEAKPGMVPCVVRKTAGVSDVGQWEVRVRDADAMSALGAMVLTLSRVMPMPVDDQWWATMSMADLVAVVRAVDAGAAS